MSLSLKHISLHNFRGIRGTLDWQFQQQPGFYFIQGQNRKEPTLGANGAGKSTIFVDGPSWILTGKTILSQRPGSSIENWELEKGSVYGELTLVIDDHEYIIKRGRRPSILTVNGRTVEQSEIDKIIPLSDAVLRRTLLLGQRSSMFLDLRPEEKSRLFSETLDLDIWLRAADFAGEKLRTTERSLQNVATRFASVSGSLNEIRDQHAIALNKEAEFTQTQTHLLHNLRVTANVESTKLDTFRETLGEAQERLNKILEGNTSDDDLRAHRARERTARDLVVTLKTDLASAKRVMPDLERKIAHYNESNVCPECGQPITDEHAHAKNNELMPLHQEWTEVLTNNPEKITVQEGLILEISQDIAELEAANVSLMELKGNVNTLAQQVTGQQQIFIRSMNEIKNAEKTVNPFSAVCDELETRYKALMVERETLQEQEDALTEETEILKFWQKGYRDIRLEQIDATLLELELAANRNAIALGLQDWEIQFATERENKSGTVSHAFSIYLFPPGQTKAIPWESYSGGEAQRWQLAVTFALSEVLLTRAGIEPDIEILDEPTTFLSQEGIDDLLECLHTRSHELQRRIFLIDHRSLERGSFDGVITVIKDDSGIRIEN